MKLPCDCNCKELVKNINDIVKDYGFTKNENLKKKLEYSRNKANFFNGVIDCIVANFPCLFEDVMV